MSQRTCVLGTTRVDFGCPCCNLSDMAFPMDMLPETGIESIDKALALVGALYVVLTCTQAFVPKASPLARFLATFTADVRGVLRASGQAQNLTESDKKESGPRKPRGRKKST